MKKGIKTLLRIHYEKERDQKFIGKEKIKSWYNIPEGKEKGTFA
jgi:hypothetical protein